ncbi:MAG: T9SS type A sorting domain-containing protein [Saprospiraceae bacterium]
MYKYFWLLFIPFQFNAQNYYTASAEGFGAAATGGGNAAPVVVSTYNELKSKILDANTPVVLVSGTITIPDGGQISSIVQNKTILGLPGARLINNTKTQSGSGVLYLKPGSSNVIIRNLTFEGPGAYDVDGRDNLTSDGCVNLWVDHCEFQDGIDGNFDIKGKSDNVTVSWCKFTYLKPPTSGGSGGANDHRYTNLVGSGSSDAPNDLHYSITFQNCYWANGCRERMPRARNGELHILNCYYNTDVSSSTALGLGGGVNNLSCYVENCDFASIGTVYKNYSSSDGGTVAVNFTGCLNGVANVGSVSAPGYAYTAYPATEVATHVANGNCGAGATLQITEMGEISSPCASVGTEESQIEKSIKCYPVIIRDFLFIELPGSTSSEAILVSIYSQHGQLVYRQKFNDGENSLLKLQLSSLSSGAYFCQIKGELFQVSKKIIKE